MMMSNCVCSWTYCGLEMMLIDETPAGSQETVDHVPHGVFTAG